MSFHVVITAGGTTESIDDVRTMESVDLAGNSEQALKALTHFEISNISKGRFGVEIARALKALDAQTEITLIGRQDLIKQLAGDPDAVSWRLVPFRSFADLDLAIEQVLSERAVDGFLMSAAVSDYSPVAVEGKISSDQDELVIRLKKNPKLLAGLRQRLGAHAFLVGFKLLSGVSHETLVEVARQQVLRCDCDCTVANDASRIVWATGWHPVSLVSAMREEWQFEGHRNDSAAALAREVLAGMHRKQ